MEENGAYYKADLSGGEGSMTDYQRERVFHRIAVTPTALIGEADGSAISQLAERVTDSSLFAGGGQKPPSETLCMSLCM